MIPRRSRTGRWRRRPGLGSGRLLPGAGASTCRCRARRRAGRAIRARARRRAPGRARRSRDGRRGRSASEMAARPDGDVASDAPRATARSERDGSRTTVSTRVFHPSHARHWPSQRRNDSPQDWQTKRLLAAPSLGRRTGGDAHRASTGVRGCSARRMSRPASGSLSTMIREPGSYLPSSRCSARTSSIMFWMTRFSGRAP